MIHADLQRGNNGGGGADAATLGPALCGSVVNFCCYVLQWRHAWGEEVEVGDVRRQLHIIDGQKPLGIFISENVGLYGGDECYPPYVPLP